MKLSNGLSINDLYSPSALLSLDNEFLFNLQKADEALYQTLISARQNPSALDKKAESLLIIALAPYLDNYIAKLFNVEDAIAKHQANAKLWQSYLVEVKRKFVQRRGLKQYNATAVEQMNGAELIAKADSLIGAMNDEPTDEVTEKFEKDYAEKVQNWLVIEADNLDAKANLAWAEAYAAWAALSPEGKARHATGRLFRKPEGIDSEHLVPLKPVSLHYQGKVVNTKVVAGDLHAHCRDGFHLTDTVKGAAYGYDQSHYCIWCHEQGRDSCQQGVRDKKTGEVQKSALGATLAGCPLSEKISEMNMLKAGGYTVAPVATVMIDNPMMAGTGHRICNDCMKACIYQKQEPVDIPQAETRNLEDVLGLPYGYEIYSLLSRWNPLNIHRPYPKAESGKKVLVVGLGPSGYTLSHHLLQEGHTVVAIDGLKIEPLPTSLSGINMAGERVAYSPISAISTLMEDLDHRTLAGFGGVSEYGITVRWNKNYLKVLRLMLERNPRFRLFGGVRFGNDTGTITIHDALSMGFDHIALCMGAGKPTVIDMENGFAPGVRQASDFLMALQLTGAGKMDSLANLQIKMPIVVVGGGLTAIDTATESMTYYIRQVEKYTLRHEMLIKLGVDGTAKLSPADKVTADTFLAHGKLVLAEREKAKAEGRVVNFIPLLQSFGGSTVVYRRSMKEAPAYVLNHEEIAKAMEEGIYFAEGLSPKKVEVDSAGHAVGLTCADSAGNLHTFGAGAILIAAGTQPNTVLAREVSPEGITPSHPEYQIPLDGKYFSAINMAGEKVTPVFATAKPDKAEVLMHRFSDGRMMSFFGDLHPSFFGNVVKAMASAKQGYPVVVTALSTISANNNQSPSEFFTHLNAQLLARVVRTERLTGNIVEVIIHAPMAAKNFHPGQFYRLQNFSTTAPTVLTSAGTLSLSMEGLALTGAWVDKAKGLVGMIVLEMGGSSNLCMQLQPNEPVVLMGPTGAPTEIHSGETVLLAGGGLGNAVLFSIGAALRAVGSKVLYFAGYRGNNDRYHIPDIEAAADTVIWCCDSAPGFTPSPSRPQDRSFVGNIVSAMEAYAKGELGAINIPLSQVDRIIAIGSDKMMAAVASARHTKLAPYLKAGHCGVGSINSPMQCMMKEICSQCLQQHKDPKSGKSFTVFSCMNQDQDLDTVDWQQLSDRLRQNIVGERQSAEIIAHGLSLMDKMGE